MGQRIRIKGRGTIDFPGHRLHGQRCFIVGATRDGQLIVKTRTPGADTLGELARVPRERVKVEPP